jgi:hypothetical protein
MLRPQPEPQPPEVVRCRASGVRPGDEVVIVDASGAHRALRPAYLVIDPAKTQVTLVPPDGPECRVAYDDDVMVVRGGDLPRFLPPPASGLDARTSEGEGRGAR